MKKYLMFFVIATLVLCTAAVVLADDLSDVVLNGTLRVGTSPEYIPFVFYDEQGGVTGIDIALLEEVGRRMGVKVQTVDLAFDGLIDSLNIGQVDIIARALSRTESRLEKIDFTRLYYKGQAEFIALKDLNKPQTVDNSSFKNLKIGVEKATSFEQWIRTNLVQGGYVDARNVYIYSNAVDMVKALDRKDVDLVVVDQDVYEVFYMPTGKYQVFYSGFMEENYAFGLRKNSTLTSVVNGHLLDMLKDGTAQKIADRFFTMNYQKANSGNTQTVPLATLAPAVQPVQPVVYPTAVPSYQPTGCVNSMVFYADVTIKDGHQVKPGEHFRKIWRVYNNGSCTWNQGYSFVYVSGDQMNGKNISIPQIVVPGQTVDLGVDLVAPGSAGTYRGNWQMRAPDGKNFGETIWVKVRVAGSQPYVAPTPTPRRQEDGQHYVPININSFYADSYEGPEGSCTNVYWSTKGASMVEITVDGTSVYRGESVNGSKQICGPITKSGSHYVQLYGFNVTTDAYSSFTYTTREEGQKRVVPEIHYFYVDPSSGYMGDTATVYWSVSNAGGIEIFVDGMQIENTQNATGSAPVQATIQSVGSHSITLVAHSVTDDATSSVVYTMQERDQGGWAGSNYYENENNHQDQGGWAGSNYEENENNYQDQGGWAGSNYEESENSYEDEGGWAGSNYEEDYYSSSQDNGSWTEENYYDEDSGSEG